MTWENCFFQNLEKPFRSASLVENLGTFWMFIQNNIWTGHVNQGWYVFPVQYIPAAYPHPIFQVAFSPSLSNCQVISTVYTIFSAPFLPTLSHWHKHILPVHSPPKTFLSSTNLRRFLPFFWYYYSLVSY